MSDTRSASPTHKPDPQASTTAPVISTESAKAKFLRLLRDGAPTQERNWRKLRILQEDTWASYSRFADELTCLKEVAAELTQEELSAVRTELTALQELSAEVRAWKR
jgi:hypothetical protein